MMGSHRSASNGGPGTGSAAGGSLVEVLVCLSIAAVVLTSIAALFLWSRRANDAADKQRIANGLVCDRLEQLMSLRFEDPRLAAGFHDDDLPPTVPDPATGDSPSRIANVFRRTYRVRQLLLPPGGSVPPGEPFRPIPVTAPGARYDFKRIDVTVEISVSRPGSGRVAARVSGVRSNPVPDEILSEASDL